MWDKKYTENKFLYGKEPNDFLREVIERKKLCIDKELPHSLCLGSGEGRNTIFLASKGFESVGMDRSKTGFENSKDLEMEKNLVYKKIKADILNYEIEANAYDLICSIWLHLPEGARESVYNKIIESLKPGGYMLLEAYRKEQKFYGPGGPPTPKIMPSLEELQCHFKSFEIIIAQEQDRHINEGLGHQGMAAVIQFLARKPFA